MTAAGAPMTDDFTDLLRRARVLPVLRVASASEAEEATARIARAGLPAVELTATTPGWSAALRRVRAAHPQLRVGLGTVWDVETADRALEHGAAFLVSPGAAPGVREAAQRAGVPMLEGGWTASELHAASLTGPAKLFPAHIGGPAHLRSVRAVLPDRHLVPTGGIRLADVGAWLEAGALAVGIGTDLLREADLAQALQAAIGR